MKELMSAGLERLLRMPVFYLCAALPVLVTLIFIILGESTNIVGATVFSNMILAFIPAVLLPAFIGSEHKFGTVRNKLICGHSRVTVYLSYFLVSEGAMLIIYAVCFLLMIGGMRAWEQEITVSQERFYMMLLVDVCAVTVMTAFCAALAACIHSGSASAAISLGSCFVMLFASFLATFMYVDVENDMIKQDIPFFARYFPVTQLFRLYFAELSPTDGDAELISLLWRNIAADGIIFAAITAAGLLIFRKRDIK